MNPISSDIFGRLAWLTKWVKNLLGRVYKIEQSGAGSYKVFTALLTQSGTDAPVVTVLENTIDPTITIVRNEASSYNIISTNNAFTLDKTYFTNNIYLPVSISGNDFKFIEFSYGDTNTIAIKTYRYSSNSWLEEDQLLFETKIEIRVYN